LGKVKFALRAKVKSKVRLTPKVKDDVRRRTKLYGGRAFFVTVVHGKGKGVVSALNPL